MKWEGGSVGGRVEVVVRRAAGARVVVAQLEAFAVAQGTVHQLGHAALESRRERRLFEPDEHAFDALSNGPGGRPAGHPYEKLGSTTNRRRFPRGDAPIFFFEQGYRP